MGAVWISSPTTSAAAGRAERHATVYGTGRGRTRLLRTPTRRRGQHLPPRRGAPGEGKSRPDNWPVRSGTPSAALRSGRAALRQRHRSWAGIRHWQLLPRRQEHSKSTPHYKRRRIRAARTHSRRRPRPVLGLTKMDWNNDALYDPRPGNYPVIPNTCPRHQ